MAKPVVAEKKAAPTATPTPMPKGKEALAVTGHCTAKACKHDQARFGFCEEHFEQFKFGLIKKTGEFVPDYEKKFEHYRAYQARRGAHKVA
jgi:hypothetical protein